VVQLEGGDSYQGVPSGVPQNPPRMPALAAVAAKASGWSRLTSYWLCRHRWSKALIRIVLLDLRRYQDSHRLMIG